MSAAVLDAIAVGVLDLLAPRTCPGCDLPLDAGRAGLCDACEPLLERLDPAASGGAAFVFAGPLADAIRRWKYGGRTDLTAPLGAILAGACTPLAGLVDVVIPVPLHPRRLQQRGYNQSALLAAVVADRLGVPVDAGALRRVRDTPPQAGLDARGRGENVRACFEARAIGSRVLLVDDVRTTGATLADAARALLASGAEAVHVRALAGAEG